jgi:hypothetical protein
MVDDPQESEAGEPSGAGDRRPFALRGQRDTAGNETRDRPAMVKDRALDPTSLFENRHKLGDSTRLVAVTIADGFLDLLARHEALQELGQRFRHPPEPQGVISTAENRPALFVADAVCVRAQTQPVPQLVRTCRERTVRNYG